jgi:hypothetical protein
MKVLCSSDHSTQTAVGAALFLFCTTSSALALTRKHPQHMHAIASQHMKLAVSSTMASAVDGRNRRSEWQPEVWQAQRKHCALCMVAWAHPHRLRSLVLWRPDQHCLISTTQPSMSDSLLTLLCHAWCVLAATCVVSTMRPCQPREETPLPAPYQPRTVRHYQPRETLPGRRSQANLGMMAGSQEAVGMLAVPQAG